tara:strand:- start:448 stop:603 length:156 start_codon:yes stop_codon:yes gene_type:complete
MKWIRDLLKKWKVQVAVVGGVVVIATAYGTCEYELPEQETSETEVESPEVE